MRLIFQNFQIMQEIYSMNEDITVYHNEIDEKNNTKVQ